MKNLTVYGFIIKKNVSILEMIILMEENMLLIQAEDSSVKVVYF